MRLAQLSEELVHAVQIGAYTAVQPRFGSSLCDRDGDGLGMDIQPDMDYDFVHGVPGFRFYF